MGKHKKPKEDNEYIVPIKDLFVTKHPAQENVDIIDESIKKHPIPPPLVTE